MSIEQREQAIRESTDAESMGLALKEWAEAMAELVPTKTSREWLEVLAADVVTPPGEPDGT